MNKVICTYLFFSTLTFTWAQTITGGVKVGFNSTKLSVSGYQVDPIVSNRRIPSFHIGGFIRKSFGGGAALQTELLYSGKGCQFEQLTGKDLRLHYLSLPVLLNLQVVKKVTLEIGPEFNYLLNSGRGLYDNRFDLCIDAGLRYDFSKVVGVGVRYNYGLSNVSTFNFASGSNQLRNQGLQASLTCSLF